MWPYPPAFFAWLLASSKLSSITGLPFHGLVQLPAIACGVGIAWMVQYFLGRRGVADKARVAAAALVMFGPSFFITSAFHGQIDAVAILPAVAGLIVWERGASGRALTAGALIGLGAAVKLPPLLMVAALLPSARSVGEGGRLVATAAAVPLLVLAPFLAANPSDTVSSFDYQGLSGQGGLVMVLQPDLVTGWLRTFEFHRTGLTDALVGHAGLLSAGLVLSAALFLIPRRVAAPTAACFIWLLIFAFGPSFALTYLALGVPFFLLAGYVAQVAALEAVVCVPTALLYLGTWQSSVPVAVYFAFMLLIWLGFIAAGFALGRSIGRSPKILAPGEAST